MYFNELYTGKLTTLAFRRASLLMMNDCFSDANRELAVIIVAAVLLPHRVQKAPDYNESHRLDFVV